MKQFKHILVMIMIMTLTLGLVGCGTKQTNNNTNQNSIEESKEPTNEASESANSSENEATEDTTVTYPVEITDSDDNVITIEAEPQTIVSVAPNMTELVYALGIGDKLIGRSTYCDYPQEAQQIETVGSLYTPDIEKIVSLEPDLVLVSTHFDEENEKKLADLGIQVICLYEEHEIYGVYDMINTLGTIVNRKAEAEELVQQMKDTFAEVASEISGLEAPSVYYVVGYGEGGDYTAGGDTFINGLIELAGGKNIASDVSGWSYSLESLLEADPDVIIIGLGNAEDFKATKNYSELTAVKEGRVYEFDTNLFNRQGYRNAEGVKELAKVLYPDAVK